MRRVEINPALVRVPMIRDKRELVDDVFVEPGHQVKIFSSLWLVVGIQRPQECGKGWSDKVDMRHPADAGVFRDSNPVGLSSKLITAEYL